MKVQNNKIERLPDHILIEEANRIDNFFADWSGGDMIIDEELEQRFNDFSDLAQYKEWQEFDDTFLSLV